MAGMSFEAFAGRSERFVRGYFNKVIERAEGDEIVYADGIRKELFLPQALFNYETPTHFASELMGACDAGQRSLDVVRAKIPSIYALLGQFPAGSNTKSCVKVISAVDDPSCQGSMLADLSLTSQRDIEGLLSRYPEVVSFFDFADVSLSSDALREEETFSSLELNDDCHALSLSNVLTMSSRATVVRLRYFQAAWLVPKAYSSSRFQRLLDNWFPVEGKLGLVPSVRGPEYITALSAINLASLTAIEKIGEITITQFLETNNGLLCRALGARRLIAQPLLRWKEGNPDPDEKAIQPDFLFVDHEGSIHVCDVKLPLLGRTQLTAGQHKRRRFVLDVTDGIEQIANYQDYLGQPAHLSYVEDLCDGKVRTPRSVLIVGSDENFDAHPVAEAMRSRKPIEIIDFDSLRALSIVRSASAY